MKRVLLTIYLVGMLISTPLIFGMTLAQTQKRFPDLADSWYRRDVGHCILFSIFNGVIWPVGLPVTYLLTGFAEAGLQYGRLPK